jgi:osmotically-inducible protein OsmY
MVRPSIVVTLILTVSPACGAGSGAPPPDAPPAPPSEASRVEQYHQMATPVAAPENAVDRGIRRDLNLAIAGDPNLKDREIRFVVSDGDVSVSGTVKNEEERKKINDLAMGVNGVKSVANALRIAE